MSDTLSVTADGSRAHNDCVIAHVCTLITGVATSGQQHAEATALTLSWAVQRNCGTAARAHTTIRDNFRVLSVRRQQL
jgi:hypothetical protein